MIAKNDPGIDHYAKAGKAMAEEFSDDKPEMVTIEVPVQWAEDYEGEGAQGTLTITANIRKALDDRKSKYDRWRGRIGISSEMLHRKTSWSPANAQLMAASPQLLEAVIAMRGDYEHATRARLSTHESISARAIRAAVPADVADELLTPKPCKGKYKCVECDEDPGARSFSDVPGKGLLCLPCHTKWTGASER